MALLAADGSGSLGARIVSALILAPAAVAITVIGGWVFAALIIVVGCLMITEWYRITDAGGTMMVPFQSVLVAGSIVAVQTGYFDLAVAAIIVGALVAVCVSFLKKLSLFWAVLGVFYTSVPCTLLVFLRGDSAGGFNIVIWIFAVVWATDIAAYVFGRTIGGAKLSRISPNKTWAGLLGGVMAAAIVGAFIADVFVLGSITAFALAGGICAIIGQCGDLFESWVKRSFDRKDSGSLIPGHGGILDRVDGLLPVIVVVALATLVGPEGGFKW